MISSDALDKKASLNRVPTLLPGLVLLLLILLPVGVGRFFVPMSHTDVLYGLPNLPPSAAYPLGTQSEGRDMLASLIYATPATLEIGLIAAVFGLVIGGILGMISGYFGHTIDAMIIASVDVALTIPPLVVLILISASFKGMTIVLMGVIIAITSWMYPTRVIRSQVLSLRERGFVSMSKLSNSSDISIMFRELMPNLVPFMAAAFVNLMSTAILVSIGLEVLGLGTQNTQTLGTIIYYALTYTALWNGWWWWWFPPVVILVVVFLSFFLISVALDSLANPRIGRA